MSDRPSESVPSISGEEQDWLESAERDYAFGSYEFFGQEWGEKLIEEVKRLRDSKAECQRTMDAFAGDVSYYLDEITGFRRTVERLEAERLLLAKLASDTPQFDNPLVAWKAQELRDKILSEETPDVPR